MHVVFVGAALAFALLGGLLLAVALPIDAALRGAIGVRWVASAQVHGHLQTIGFVGLFITGMAYRLLPGFAGAARLLHPRLVLPSFWLLAGGVLARAVGQPAAEHPVFAAIMIAGAWAELLGAATFAANVFPLAWRAARGGRPFAPFFLAGTSWFVLQAALGAVWLTQLGIAHGSVLALDRDQVMIFLQLFGFHLMFILGVATRSFPVMFAAQPATMPRVRLAWSLAQIGIAMLTVGEIVQVYRPGSGWATEDVGAALAGSGLLLATFLTGWWRAPTRIRPASRPFAYTLQPAMAWLAIAGSLVAIFAIAGLLRGEPPSVAQWDTARHIVAIGVVLMTIVGMAQLILPELASERLVGRQGAWRGITFGVALSIATLARVLPRLLDVQLPGEWTYWLMALAGLIALLVLGLLAFFYARGVRDYREVIAIAGARLERPGPPREDW